MHGHEVHIATSFKNFDGSKIIFKEAGRRNVTFHQVCFPRSANLVKIYRSTCKLSALVRHLHPDWIQAHFSIAALVCALAKKNNWPHTSCVIQGLASALMPGASRWLSYLGERYAMSKLDEMWVLTDGDYSIIKKWNSRKARLQKALGFGCRLNEFSRASFSKEFRIKRRHELGILQEELVLIFIGRFVAFKGFHQALRSYWTLRDQGLPVRLLIIGNFDPMHDSGLTKLELQRLHQDSDIIMPGWQEKLAMNGFC